MEAGRGEAQHAEGDGKSQRCGPGDAFGDEAELETEDIAERILTAMHLPADIPKLHPARPPPQKAGGGDDWVN